MSINIREVILCWSVVAARRQNDRLHSTRRRDPVTERQIPTTSILQVVHRHVAEEPEHKPVNYNNSN